MRTRRRHWLAAGLALLLALGASQAAPAKTASGLTLTSGDAIGIAKETPEFGQVKAEYGKLETVAEAKPPDSWEIGFFSEADDKVLLVVVNDPQGTVREAWTGIQVAWPMARGYEGAFGRSLNSPWIWLPLCAAFVFGLFDFRRARRLAHLDLIVIAAGFGISHAFFNAAEIEAAVWLFYPPLLYLLGRMLWIGFRGTGAGLRPSLPLRWMVAACAVLLVFRVALNLADSNTIDVGYAGVIGADRITQGEQLWGNFPQDNRFGDTYGPATYLPYVPLELAFPWEGAWDELRAAHAAALIFDLSCVALLFAIGRRLREGPEGTSLGVVLAFAWLACPYTLFALNSNSNDSLVGALILAALHLALPRPGADRGDAGRPFLRGAAAAAATLTKFAPAALMPLFAVGTRGLADRPPLRGPLLFAAGVALLGGGLVAYALIDAGLSVFWERTLASQLDRTSPFSAWGQVGGIEWLQWAVKALAAALAIAVAFVPRRRSPAQLAALAAAVVIAVQLFAEHWFYLYVPWFFGLVAVAIVSRPGAESARSSAPARPNRPRPAPR